MSKDILIVGGGLNGPALALGLAQAGFAVTVIDALPAETRAEPAFDGRAYALALASVRLLRNIGVWDGVAGRAQPMLGIRVSDGHAGQGGGLKELRVAAHYACRTRNNRKGGKISEHGKGRAIDISGFELADGRTITVLKGWRARRSSKAMRRMHQGACGPFGTVLGPESDRFHQDHFHFDTARYRSGSYCR